jgi:hypothetical protein
VSITEPPAAHNKVPKIPACLVVSLRRIMPSSLIAAECSSKTAYAQKRAKVQNAIE